MPLSEDEQRILRQIEEQLQGDPQFRGSARPAATRQRRSAAGLVAATVALLGLTVLLLAASPYISFVTFVAAVVTGALAERQLRDLAGESVSQLSDAVRVRRPGPRQRPSR